MIPRREIDALQSEWRLRHDVIEKDYVLGWLLAGIAQSPALSGWVFKGGTCLRKCYFETYRFSQDLDFTVPNGAELSAGWLVETFAQVADWVRDASGLEVVVTTARSVSAATSAATRPSRAGSRFVVRWTGEACRR